MKIEYGNLMEIIEEETNKLIQEFSSNVITKRNEHIIPLVVKIMANKGADFKKIPREEQADIMRTIHYFIYAGVEEGQLTSKDMNLRSIVERAINIWDRKKKQEN